MTRQRTRLGVALELIFWVALLIFLLVWIAFDLLLLWLLS